MQRTNTMFSDINLRSTEISDNRSIRSIIGELPAERERERERETPFNRKNSVKS